MNIGESSDLHQVMAALGASPLDANHDDVVAKAGDALSRLSERANKALGAGPVLTPDAACELLKGGRLL